MPYSTIKFTEPEKGIGLLTLNKPGRLNAVSLKMLAELDDLFKSLSDDDKFRVLLLTGAGRGFCSGADLRDEALNVDPQGPLPDAATHLFKVQKVFSDRIIQMRRLPQPIIAAVNGVAAGGGMCLAMASEVILASPQAAFIASFANIGLSGGELGSSYLLPRLVGASRTAEILLTGRKVMADEAERIGLCSQVVEEGRLVETAMDMARQMLDKSPKGLRLTKESINFSANAPSLEAAIEFENRTQSLLCSTAEFADAVKRFSKK